MKQLLFSLIISTFLTILSGCAVTETTYPSGYQTVNSVILGPNYYYGPGWKNGYWSGYRGVYASDWGGGPYYNDWDDIYFDD